MKDKLDIKPLYLFFALPLAAAFGVTDLAFAASDGQTVFGQITAFLATALLSAAVVLLVVALLPRRPASKQRPPLLLPSAFLLIVGLAINSAQSVSVVLPVSTFSALLIGSGSALLLLAWSQAYALINSSAVLSNTAIALAISTCIHQLQLFLLPGLTNREAQLFAVVLALLSAIPLEIVFRKTSGPVEEQVVTKARFVFISASYKVYFGFMICWIISACFWGTLLSTVQDVPSNTGVVFRDVGIFTSGAIALAIQVVFLGRPQRFERVFSMVPILAMTLLMLAWFVVLINPDLNAIDQLLVMVVTGMFTILLWSAISDASRITGTPNRVLGLASASFIVAILLFATLSFFIRHSAEFISPILMLGYLALVNLVLGKTRQKANAQSNQTTSMNNQRLVDASDHYKLSQREREILVLLTKGLSNTFIAETLCISPNSVKTHVRHIYEKLDVHKRDEMVALIDAYSPDPSAQDI